MPLRRDRPAWIHRRRLRLRRSGLGCAVAAFGGCGLDPAFDLEGPRLVRSDLHERGSVEVPVFAPLVFRFSEPLDPDSVHPGSVAMRAWEEVGRCDLSPICDEGQCVRGRCVEPSWTSGWLTELRDGEALGDVELAFERFDEGRALRVRPLRALSPHRRYTLWLGPAVRDRAGNPLGAGAVDVQPLRFDFTTAGSGSSGPEARMRWPAPGSRDVPTNLAFVEVWFETQWWPGATRDPIQLQSEAGDRVDLKTPEPCPGWVPGSCWRWSLGTALAPEQRHALWVPERSGPPGDSVSGRTDAPVDAPMVPPAEIEWFETGREPDQDPPELETRAHREGSCRFFEVEVDEFVQLELNVELTAPGVNVSPLAPWRKPEDIEMPSMAVWSEGWEGSGRAEFAWREGAGSSLWSLDAVDAAGGRTSMRGRFSSDDASPDSAVDGADDLAIVELLANAEGDESAGEFVELARLDSDDPASKRYEGLYLSDLPWSEVHAALSTGASPPGDPLGPFELDAGALALVVSDAFELDARVEPSTVVLRIGSSIAAGGLKNAGEPLTLYRADPPRLLSTYGAWIESSSSASEGRGIVRRPEAACDLAAAWSMSSDATARTPGWRP